LFSLNRRRCGKPVTLPDNLRAGRKESQSRRNHSKNWMLAGRVFGRGDMIAIPLPNIGSMGGECGPLRKCAIAERLCRRNYDNWGCLHEIYGRQALDRGRWPQNEREPRRCILERVEGDRARAAHDLVGVGRRNRCSAATRQSVIGPSAFRARILSHPAFPRKGRARRNSRDDRLHCARFFLSLCGQPYQQWLSIVGRCIY
jgi:hypothetical protein